MSRPQQAQFEFAREINPASELEEPDLWFQELRLLKRLSSEECIRKIPMRQGLNILWSPPEDGTADEGLYQDSWGGHAAGKTLFCRILRFLIGDTCFCTGEVLDSIRGKFTELWAVARIRLRSKSWIVGRSLLDAADAFATQTDGMDAVLDGTELRGDFAAFRGQLELMASHSLNSLYPQDAWRHLLPWLARDQEARYARVTAWRDSLSEADNPSTSMSKQYALMRAVLGLLDLEELTVQAEIDTLEEEARKADAELVKEDAVVQRELKTLETKLQRLLGIKRETQTFATLADHLESQREVREERLQQLGQEEEPLPLKEARWKYETALNKVLEAKSKVESGRANSKQLREQGNKFMGTANRIKSAGISDPKRIAEGWCPLTYERAQERGCVEKHGVSDSETNVTLDELIQQANQLIDDAEEAERRAARLESELEQLEGAAETAKLDFSSVIREARKEVGTLEREIAVFSDVEQQVRSYDVLALAVGTKKATRDSFISGQKERRDKLEKLRTNVTLKLHYLDGVFSDVIKAVVGASVDAWVKIDGNGLHLHASKQSELSGAALETVKTLAFDLAGVVAGIENQGFHPRFLIHDGPREADMARVIYERFFVYAVDRIERAFKGKPTFQYIVTTTTPPPAYLQDRSRWLIEKLSSKNKADRLLCENV